MTNAMGTYYQVTTAAVWTVQEATLDSPWNPTEAYTCNLYVLGPMESRQQVSFMAAEDCQQSQLADPILREEIKRLQDSTLGQCSLKSTDPAKLKQLLRECNHLKLRRGIL